MSNHPDQNPEKQSKKKGGIEELGGILIPMLVLSLVFGKFLGGITLLGAVAVIGIMSMLDAGFRARLVAVTQQPDKPLQKGMGLAIPALALSGIFGGPILMVALIVILAVLGILYVFGINSPNIPAPETPVPLPTTLPAALPAQAQGEPISALDVRALCRGLPPLQAGQVISTVEHLEFAMAEAESRGNVKAAYDARQALREYLPNTVEAWKAQAEQDQHLAELDRALLEVRAIAGTDDASAQRRAWETQQRFLRSRGGQSDLSLEPLANDLKKR